MDKDLDNNNGENLLTAKHYTGDGTNKNLDATTKISKHAKFVNETPKVVDKNLHSNNIIDETVKISKHARNYHDMSDITGTIDSVYKKTNPSDTASFKAVDKIKNTKTKRKKGPIFWIALVVLIASLTALGIIIAGYLNGQFMYRDISEEAFKQKSDEINLKDMKVDWDKLLAINPDTVAWIYIPGTQINYPIVHTNNNDQYLRMSFRRTYPWVYYGTIFMDCNNKHDLTDPNIVTYGHNMNDGSMYSLFAQMKDSDVFNSHRNIYFLTPKGNYKLTSFSLVRVLATEKIVQPNFSNPKQMQDYITDKINRKIVDVEGDIPNPADMSKIFMFSTCDNSQDTYRFICYAYVEETTVPGDKAVK